MKILLIMLVWSLPFNINAQDKESTFGRGLYRFQRLEDYKGAIDDFTNEIKRDPKSQGGYLYRGEAKSRLGDYLGAISDFQELITFIPNQESAHISLALCYSYLNRNTEAVSTLTHILSFNAKSRNAYYYRGIIKLSFDEMGAVEDFSNAIGIDHSDADSYHSRARGKFMMKDYKSALLDYNIALTIDSNRPLAYLQRGNIKLILKDDVGARLDFKKAAEMGESEGQRLGKVFCN